MAAMIFPTQLTVNCNREEFILLLLLCVLGDINEKVRISFFLDAKVLLHSIKLVEIAIGIQEDFMSDDKQQLVFPVDFLDLLSQCLAPLKPLVVLGVWVLLPDQGRWMEELDQGRNDGTNTMGLLSGCHFCHFLACVG